MLTVSGTDITNAITLNTIGSGGTHTSASDVVYDAAGNIYITNSATTAGNVGQILQVFSPGGNTLARTSGTSAGGINNFVLLPGSTGGIAGDYNNNGVVDAADYVVWRNAGPADTLPNDSTPGSVSSADYDVFKANFGKTAGSGSGASNTAVPEPSTIVLLALGLVVGMGRRKRTA